MADKQKILELDIDIESIIAKSVQLKSSLDGMRAEMDKLKKSGDTSSENFVKLEASIKATSAEYNLNQKQLQNLASANSSFLTIQDKVSISLDKEINSIAGARANNAELLKIRNELNLKTEAGAKAADLINAKLDQNNAFIKENVSQYEQQKINIGNYKEAITGALNETGLFNGQLGELRQIGGAVSGIFGLLNKDFAASGKLITDSAKGTDGMTQSQRALTVATNVGTGALRIFSLALAALGIGLIIAAIALLIGYFKTFDPLVDKIEQGMAGLGGAIRTVQQFIVGLFTDMKKLGDFITNPIGALRNLGKEMKATAKEAANLKEEQQKLADSAQVLEIQNKKTESQIKRLLLQSKDLSKSEAERARLADEALKLSQENFEKNKAQSDAEYENVIRTVAARTKLSKDEIAQLRERGTEYAAILRDRGSAVQNFSDEEVQAIQDAEAKKIETENAGLEQQERIQSKRNSLIEKAMDKAKAHNEKMLQLRQQALDDAATLMQQELDIFLQTSGKRAEGISEELRLAEEVKKRKLAIAQAEFNATKKTQIDRNNLLKAQNQAIQEFTDAQLSAVERYAKAELDLFLSQNRSKIEGVKVLTQELVDEEAVRIQNIANEKLNQLALEKKTNQQIIDAKRAANKELSLADLEYLTEKSNLELQAQKDLDANKKAFEIQKKQERADELALENELELAAATTKFEEEKIKEQQQYEEKLAVLEQRKADGLISEEEYQILLDDLYARHAQNQKDIELAAAQYKIGLINNTLDQAKGLFKQHTVAYKAIAIAQTLMNTYLSAMQAYKNGLELGGPAGLVAGPVFAGIAVAAGLKNIAEIAGVKLKKGGWLGNVARRIYKWGGEVVRGPSHEQGGVPFRIKGSPVQHEMEGDEIIMTRGVFRNPYLRKLASQINVAGGGVAFAGGGVPYPTSNLTTVNNLTKAPADVIDYDLLAEKLSKANEKLPPPRVAVDDINLGQKGLAEVVDGANL